MGERKILIDVLSVFFGLGTWVVVNGLWVELPLLVRNLPESWNLPSYLTIIVQLSNIAPLLYSILHHVNKELFTEIRAIYFVIALGLVSNTFLIFYWDTTTYIFGNKHSVVLFVLSFCLAMVDCSSRVLYLPFMARFQTCYLTSFFIGEGLSGLIPSIFALIQGVGGNPECVLMNVTNGNITEEKVQAVYKDPLFSVEIFLLLLVVIVAISLIAFHLLTMERVTAGALAFDSGANRTQFTGEILLDSEIVIPTYNAVTQNPTNSPLHVIPNNNYSETGHSKKLNLGTLSESLFYYLLVVLGIVSALANGVFPSIGSYSSLPYGNVAYHLSTSLSVMANPIVCFSLFVLPKPTRWSITAIFACSVGVAIYVMYTAVMSPTPPLVNETSGEVLLVLGWVLLVGTFTYVKVSIATVLREAGKRGLFWCGVVTQIGSSFGAIIMFLIVNNTNIFQSYIPCQDFIPATSTTSSDFLIF